ncbi:unnamed protein product [Diamesa tonsa]
MGAGSKTKQIVCSRTAELSQSDFKRPTVNLQLLDEENSTLPINDAVKLVNNCIRLETHEEELKKFKEVGSKTPILPREIGTDPNYKMEIVWFNAIGFVILHIIGLSGALYGVLGLCKIRTSLYSLWLIYAAGQGVTMGAHRMWSHKAFKAKKWLKIILLYMHTLAGQNCLWVWVRDHRQHHKYSDTDADPHNANRGFFFSHMGWLCVRKHPKVIEYGGKIDMSDLDADPWIMFQKRHYKVLYTIFALGLPTVIPIIFWDENPIIALWVAYFARTILNLNVTWLVNSAAHLYGTRPYDDSMFPVENMFVAALAAGEGWHNYHHAFPWDYRAAELGTPLNLTCKFIDFFAKYGVIYDLKEATSNMVRNRVLRTGDKSHHTYGIKEAAPAVKTLFNICVHPLNPTYSSVDLPKPKSLPKNGYALIEAELPKRELDDKILAVENEILQERLDEEEERIKSNASHDKKLDGSTDVMGDSLSKYTDENSNYVDSKRTQDSNNNETRRRNKSSLNIDDFPHPSTSGLAL